MLLYEVTATVPPEHVEAYERHMRERHVADVLATGAFERAVFTHIAPGRYRVCYEAASRIALDRYLKEHAPRLRADFASHFPKGIELAREIWTLVRTFEAGSNPGAS